MHLRRKNAQLPSLRSFEHIHLTFFVFKKLPLKYVPSLILVSLTHFSYFLFLSVSGMDFRRSLDASNVLYNGHHGRHMGDVVRGGYPDALPASAGGAAVGPAVGAGAALSVHRRVAER